MEAEPPIRKSRNGHCEASHTFRLVRRVRLARLRGLLFENPVKLSRSTVKPVSVFRSLLWLAVMAACPVAHALEVEPEQALALTRLSFERAMIEASLEPLKKHLIELTTLERQRAEARDYTGAIEARDLKRRVEDDLGRLDKELLLLQTREQSMKASLLPDRIVLPLDDAKLAGVTRRDGSLTGWSKPGAAALWTLPKLPPGGYEVILKYRCGPLEGGSLVVQEARFNLRGEVGTTLKGPEEKNLGTLKITDGTGPLTVAAQAVVKDNLMQLLKVELVPASR